MRFHAEDNGFCRVYYKRRIEPDGEGRAVHLLYCWQNDGYGGNVDFQFYRCSRDGEPDYKVNGWGGVAAKAMTPPPPGETDIGRQLRAFLEEIPANAPSP